MAKLCLPIRRGLAENQNYLYTAYFDIPSAYFFVKKKKSIVSLQNCISMLNSCPSQFWITTADSLAWIVEYVDTVEDVIFKTNRNACESTMIVHAL